MIIIIITLSFILAGFIYYLLQEDPVEKQIEEVKKNPPRIPEISEDKSKELESRLDNNDIEFEYLTLEEIAYLIRKKYGKHIRDRWTQIRLIEELIRILKLKYPDGWITELYVILKASFSDIGDEIFKRFEDYQKYQNWLEDHREEVLKMSEEERTNLLWNKRYEFFGEEAANEIWKAELQSQELKKAIYDIDKSSDNWQNKLKDYKQVIKDIYKDNSDSFVQRRNLEVSEIFLQIPSIQQELKNMDNETRYKTLRDIRSYLGMSQEAIKNLENLDKERDIRWEVGYQYNAERKKLISQGASEEDIHKLRLKFFNNEMAETLKQEEESGFYRFEIERTVGVN